MELSDSPGAGEGKGNTKDVIRVAGSHEGPVEAPCSWDRNFLGLGLEQEKLSLVPMGLLYLDDTSDMLAASGLNGSRFLTIEAEESLT